MCRHVPDQAQRQGQMAKDRTDTGREQQRIRGWRLRLHTRRQDDVFHPMRNR